MFGRKRGEKLVEKLFFSHCIESFELYNFVQAAFFPTIKQKIVPVSIASNEKIYTRLSKKSSAEKRFIFYLSNIHTYVSN